MPQAIDFLVEATMEGRVLSLDVNSTPEAVEKVLGTGFIDDVDNKKRHMRRDYGLVEFYFQPKDGGWKCNHISIQVHRLVHGDKNTVPSVLTEKYGDFPAEIPFADIVQRLAESHPDVSVQSETSDGDYKHVALSQAKADITVWQGQDGKPPAPGSIWSITIQ